MESKRRLRVLVAKPGLDGHDRGAKVIARALRDAGHEVVYTGLHQSVEAIVASAVAEDVDVVGLSVLSGAHLAYVRAVRAGLDAAGADDVAVVIGGIIPFDDVTVLGAAGADAVFPSGFNILDLDEAMQKLSLKQERCRNG